MRSRTFLRRLSPLDLPMLLLLLSAFGGLLVSYDPRLSGTMSLTFAVGVGLYYLLAGVHFSERAIRLLATALVLAGVAVALYFVTQYGYLGYPDKVGWAAWVGRAISRWSPRLGSYAPHPNSVATFLEGLLPMILGLAVSARRRWLRAVYGLMAGLVGLALLVSASRGAWLALTLTALLWAACRLRPAGVYLALLLAAALVVAGMGVVAGLDLPTPGAVRAVGRLLASLFARPDRVEVYRNSLYLIRDFPFTGIGLGDTFAMVYARYALLIRVPFLRYAHNLFLETWLRQGLLGIVAFLWLVVAFSSSLGRVLVRSVGRGTALFQGIFLGVVSTLFHGLTDARQYAEGWTFFPFFALLGLAVAEGRRWATDGPGEARPVAGRWVRKAWPAAGAGVLLVGLALAGRSLVAMAWANAGGVAQARSELNERLSDAERDEFLRRARGLYQRALAWDGRNPTARQGLGLLALDAGRYDEAVTHLGLAYEAMPGRPAVRKALGLACMWEGDLDRAEPLLAGLPGIVEELNVWGWWRTTRGEAELAARAYRMSLRLQPGQASVEKALAALGEE